MLITDQLRARQDLMSCRYAQSSSDELRTLLTPAQHAAIHHFLQYLVDLSATFRWEDNDSPTLQQLAEQWNVRGN